MLAILNIYSPIQEHFMTSQPIKQSILPSWFHCLFRSITWVIHQWSKERDMKKYALFLLFSSIKFCRLSAECFKLLNFPASSPSQTCCNATLWNYCVWIFCLTAGLLANRSFGHSVLFKKLKTSIYSSWFAVHVLLEGICLQTVSQRNVAHFFGSDHIIIEKPIAQIGRGLNWICWLLLLNMHFDICCRKYDVADDAKLAEDLLHCWG